MKIRKRLRLGFAGQVLLTVLLGAGAVAALESANRQFTFVAKHQGLIIARARHLTKLVIDMETGQRGFCITRKEEFLEPYFSGKRDFYDLLAREIRRLAAHPEQVAMLEHVGRLVDEWRARAAEPQIAMARRVLVAQAEVDRLQRALDVDPDRQLIARILALVDALEHGFAERDDWQGAFLVKAIAASLVERDSGLRAFVAGGDPHDLRTYANARDRFQPLVARLRGVIGSRAPDPGTADELTRLERLVEMWTAHAAEPAIAARHGVDRYPESLEDVAALLQAKTGKDLVDRIRRALDGYIAVQVRHGEAHYTAAQDTYVIIRVVVSGILLAAIVLGAWLARDTSGAIAGPIAELARGADRIGQGNLDTRVPIAEVAELRDLGHAFNAMAYRLQEASRARRKAEDALYAVRNLESLGTVAGGIAHDFNNILTGILGNLSLALEDAGGDDELYALLLEAQHAATTATGLTRQLLTFSKGGEPLLKTVELGPLLMEVGTFTTRGSPSKCEFAIADDLLPVRVDPDQVSQVLQNLVLNATQAMPRGGIIRISARNISISEADTESSSGGHFVRVSVTDQGVGIPEDHLARIFDLYFSTKEKGRGLGLATGYSIITKHGGTFNVESEEGVGTTFSFTLPADLEAAAETPAQLGAIETGTGRVLVMDDDETVLTTIERMLDRLGYACDLAVDGHSALSAYRKARDGGSPYDVVIMDLTIPGGMGGRDANARLKAMDPDARSIASSGYSNDPVLADHAAYGFDDVLAKPYTLLAVSDALRRCLVDRAQADRDGPPSPSPLRPTSSGSRDEAPRVA